jgi:beta-phosphoglucomutase
MQEIGLIWDLDGTLVDTKDFHFKSWHEAMLTVGINLDYQLFQQNFGRNNTEIIPIYLGYTPDKNVQTQLSDVKEDIFLSLVQGRSLLFEGVKNWLDYFQKQDYHQAIASSAPMKNIDALINPSQIRSYFEKIISGAHLPSKPAPDVFQLAARELNLKPAQCIVIEDAHAGLQAGRSAGMKTIGVATSHPLDSLQADLVIPDYSLDPSKVIKFLLIP